jgi:hypothetical protein
VPSSSWPHHQVLYFQKRKKNKQEHPGRGRDGEYITTTCRPLCCPHLSRKVKARTTDAHKDTHAGTRNKPHLLPLFRSPAAESGGPGAEAVTPHLRQLVSSLLLLLLLLSPLFDLALSSFSPAGHQFRQHSPGCATAAAAGFFPNCAVYSVLWIELLREATPRCSACARAAAGCGWCPAFSTLFLFALIERVSVIPSFPLARMFFGQDRCFG